MPDSINIDRDLSDTDRVAYDARAEWLRSAWDTTKRTKFGAGKQIPPSSIYWEILLFRAGRGFGKTRAECEWAWWEGWQFPNLYIHALAATLNDVKGTLFEGQSGFRACIPPECLKGGSWEKAFRSNVPGGLLTLANGTLIRGFATTEEAKRLRGPQCHAMIGDEVAWWDSPPGNLESSMDTALMGLRLPWPDGRPARGVFGTTPRVIPFMKRWEKRKNTVVINGSTMENFGQLDAAFRNKVMIHQGTQLEKQEIFGEYIEDEDFGIFKRSWFRLWPTGKKLPQFSFIIISLDTGMKEADYDSKKRETDPTACTVWGVFNVPQNFTPEEMKRMGVRGRYAALLCDGWAEHLDFPDLCEKVRKHYATKWGNSPGKRADLLLIEDKASGISLRQVMLRYNLPTWPYNPGRQSKTMRAHAMAPYAKQGCFFIPESGREDRKGQPRDWCEPFLEEVCAFAGEGSTQHDDYVDSFTQAGIYLQSRDMLSFDPLGGIPIDYEEKRAREIEEATRQYQEERPATNPYGA